MCAGCPKLAACSLLGAFHLDDSTRSLGSLETWPFPSRHQMGCDSTFPFPFLFPYPSFRRERMVARIRRAFHESGVDSIEGKYRNESVRPNRVRTVMSDGPPHHLTCEPDLPRLRLCSFLTSYPFGIITPKEMSELNTGDWFPKDWNATATRTFGAYMRCNRTLSAVVLSKNIKKSVRLNAALT